MKKVMHLPGGSILDFSGPALIMAIVNCNEDSFYAPSRALGDEAVEKALAAGEEGASIIDFGAESSRPASVYPVEQSCISAEEEIRRLVPVIKEFRKQSSIPVSVDTRKAPVARAALDEGADIINDISSLSDDPLMVKLCAERGAAVVLMHKGDATGYTDVLVEVGTWLRQAAERAAAAGISKDKIIVDPGIGFGKSLGENLEILRRLHELSGRPAGHLPRQPELPRLAEKGADHYPVMAGLSRKSFVGGVTGRELGERLPGTLAANAAAIMGGADIIRVHDVKEHLDLVKMLFALYGN